MGTPDQLDPDHRRALFALGRLELAAEELCGVVEQTIGWLRSLSPTTSRQARIEALEGAIANVRRAAKSK